MNNYLILLFVLIGLPIFGQTTYTIDGFSEKYFAELTIAKGFENEVFKKGSIILFDSKTKKELVNIQSEELTFDVDNLGTVKTNIKELPYGEQSVLIYEDFNFDGIKDLALMDGQYSCYGGPSFQIYLETYQGLQYSPEFTRLAQAYCGMFDVDHKNQTLHTMTKSGCCWHQFSTFKVINNIPQPVLVIEEDATDFPFHTTKTIKWNGGEKQESITKTIDLQQEGITSIFSFKLAKNQKQVVIYRINQMLYYVLIRPDKTVEFSYPVTANNPDFWMDENKNCLGFTNKNITYEIYETAHGDTLKKIGVLVTVNGKTYDLKGDVNTIKGTLKAIKSMELDNIIKD